MEGNWPTFPVSVRDGVTLRQEERNASGRFRALVKVGTWGDKKIDLMLGV